MSEIRNEEELKEEILDSEDCEIEVLEPENEPQKGKIGMLEGGIIVSAIIGAGTVVYWTIRGGKAAIVGVKKGFGKSKNINFPWKEKKSKKKTDEIPEEETKTEEVKTEEEVKEEN